MSVPVAGVILGGAHIWQEDASQCLEPRLLLPVANVPLVQHLLWWLQGAGISEVVLCANEGTRFLRCHLRDGRAWGVRLQYYVDRIPRGPAGCLGDACRLVEADTYVVVEGSIIPTVDPLTLLARHRYGGADMTMVVYRQADATKAGLGGSSPLGVYAFSRRILGGIPVCSYQDIKETLVPQLLRAGGALCVFPVGEASPRLSGLSGYLAMQRWVLERARQDGRWSSGYTWQGTIGLQPGVRLAPSARVIGPALVGADTYVGDGALVIGPAVIGPGCRLDPGVLISDTVLWGGAVVEREARVESCVVAAGAVVRRRACLRGVVHRATPRAAARAGSTE